MNRYMSWTICLLLLSSTLHASSKENERLRNSATVLEEILSVPDDIPKDLLEKAECVIIFPSVRKGAFIVGGSYGRGAMVCRSGENFTGPWGAPAMYALEAGSVGFQIGGQATDLVLLVMNKKGANSILDSKVKLGLDASVAAGPKGRDAQAATDAYMNAEILSYSRTRGLFAGISLEGATLRPDNDATTEVYGRKLKARAIVLGNGITTPAAGQKLVQVLRKAVPINESEPSSLKPAV